MRNIIRYSVAGLLTVLVAGCKKSDPDPGNGQGGGGGSNNPSTFGLGAIEANLDGTLVLCTQKQNGVDTIDNYYDVSDKVAQITRGKAPNPFPAWSVAFLMIDLDTLTVPFTFDQSNEAQISGSAAFSLMESMGAPPAVMTLDKPYSITISSKFGDVLEGTFEGWMNKQDPVTWDIDSSYVSSGRFKVQVVRR